MPHSSPDFLAPRETLPKIISRYVTVSTKLPVLGFEILVDIRVPRESKPVRQLFFWLKQNAARGVVCFPAAACLIWALLQQPALAQGPVRLSNTGANGRNGNGSPSASCFFTLFRIITCQYTGDSPGSGSAGTDFNVPGASLPGFLSFSAGPAVSILSVGGNGGNGDLPITPSSYAATNLVTGGQGGAGGTISASEVVQLLFGTPGSTTPSALLFVGSQGGTGGNGVVQGDSTAGGGGAGGNVSFQLSAAPGGPRTVEATGNQFAALWAYSQGGGAGNKMPANGSGGGGNVTVGISGDLSLSTAGTGSPVVVLSSIGGGGGNANLPFGVTFAANGLGSGANGGAVDMKTGAGTSLLSYGTQSPGLLLTSIGGGPQINTSGAGGGLTGGNGGNGGLVTATLAGSVLTGGGSSPGVIAQSVGAAGGSGTGGVLTSGNGGNSGNGAAVSIFQNGVIATAGDNSGAVVAQSVGGGGAGGALGQAQTSGNGGSAGSVLAPFFGQSGFGGSGGNGGDVTVTNTGSLSTKGASSNGIFAQSIGGGGGGAGDILAGGLAVTVALGDNGGNGGAGGNVSVTQQAVATAPVNAGIVTSGTGSAGIFAQSVGGGGGAAGNLTSYTLGVQGAIAIAIGGNGGNGGGGGAVTVTNGLGISTSGNTAPDIEALSVGGGGGAGGNQANYSLALGAKTASASASLSLGGGGGAGNTGGTVGVSNNSALTSTGSGSLGIKAESIGGGGGNAQTVTSIIYPLGFGVPAAFDFNIGVGGAGGTGSVGGDVRVSNGSAGVITTSGDLSDGIFAQSVGGGGGTGGSVALLTKDPLPAATKVRFGLNTLVGGSGGSGNAGGNVNVNNLGQIATSGQLSIAIYAQSIGGGGGIGGDASTAEAFGGAGLIATGIGAISGVSAIVADSKSYSVNVGVGGVGSTASPGGTVSVVNNGALSTSGVMSYGIWAQSVGGGGGQGGLMNLRSTGSMNANVSTGGGGGSGGDGGAVTVSNGTPAGIVTTGYGATAIYAQSIGGGGGQGASAATNTGSGFFDTADKNAGKTAISNLARYLVSKKYPVADLPKLQADLTKNIGTKGGKFVAKQAGKGASVPKQLSLSLSVGGRGGVSGNGGTIDVSNAGNLTTSGQGANGIFAQSVGGGGGNGGMTETTSDRIFSLRAAVGGSGGAGGNGGAVTVVNFGAITTYNDSSFGILAQSIGGGGGSEAVAINGNQNDILPLPQVVATMGGSGGATGNGGTVAVTTGSNAVISTSGAQSIGVVGQSIAGGGGILNYTLYNPNDVIQLTNVLAAYGVTPDQAGLTTALQEARAILPNWGKAILTWSLNLGASGPTSGNGGDVSVAWNGQLATSGTGALGILAQSISGGGGLVTDGDGTVSASTTLSGQLGADSNSQNGNAGAVTVTVGYGARIATSGAGAAGILAQSIGGGGGYAGLMDVTQGGYASMLTSQNVGGNGGAVTVQTVTNSNIVTTGANAPGIFAQSLGGGGGALGINNSVLIPTAIGTPRGTNGVAPSLGVSPGQGGPISISLAGNLTVTGAGSDGIFAQSGVQGSGGLTAPGTSAAPITIALGTGAAGPVTAPGMTLYTAPGSGYAIRIDGGANNVINIGANATVLAGSGNAIWSSWGSVVINDYGALSGNIVLADGNTQTVANRLTISGGGIFDPGPVVNLGKGALDVSSGGTIRTGMAAGAVPTTVTGTLRSAGGVFDFGLDLAAGQAANLDVSGKTTLISTKFTGHVLALPAWFIPGQLPVLNVLTSSLAIDRRSVSPQSTAVFNFSVPTVTPTAIGLQLTSANYLSAGLIAAPGTTADMFSVAEALQKAWDMGHLGSYAPVFAYLGNEQTIAAYQSALRHSDDNAAALAGSVLAYSNLKFEDTLNSCPVFLDEDARLGEASCTFLRPVYNSANFSGQGNQPGFSSSSYGLALGGQYEIRPGWYIGGVVTSGQSGGVDPASVSSVNTTSAGVGVVVKHLVTDRFLLAASLGYGNDSITTSRGVQDPFYRNVTAASRYAMNNLNARLSARYDIPFEKWYVQPGLDLDLTYARMSPYTESGANYLDISYQATSRVMPSVTPKVEVGWRLPLNATTVRLYTKLGVTWLVNPGWSQTGHFVDLPWSSFTTSSYGASLLGRVTAGVQIFALRQLSVDAEYNGVYSAGYNSNGASQQLNWTF